MILSCTCGHLPQTNLENYTDIPTLNLIKFGLSHLPALIKISQNTVGPIQCYQPP